MLNFSEYKVLKMKFWHEKRYKFKDSTDHDIDKFLLICKIPIIKDKNSLF